MNLVAWTAGLSVIALLVSPQAVRYAEAQQTETKTVFPAQGPNSLSRARPDIRDAPFGSVVPNTVVPFTFNLPPTDTVISARVEVIVSPLEGQNYANDQLIFKGASGTERVVFDAFDAFVYPNSYTRVVNFDPATESGADIIAQIKTGRLEGLLGFNQGVARLTLFVEVPVQASPTPVPPPSSPAVSPTPAPEPSPTAAPSPAVSPSPAPGDPGEGTFSLKLRSEASARVFRTTSFAAASSGTFPSSQFNAEGLGLSAIYPDLRISRRGVDFLVQGGAGGDLVRKHEHIFNSTSLDVFVGNTSRSSLASGCMEASMLTEHIEVSNGVPVGYVVTRIIAFEADFVESEGCEAYFSLLEARLLTGERPSPLWDALIASRALNPAQDLETLNSFSVSFGFDLTRTGP